jgi:hypothetical protein
MNSALAVQLEIELKGPEMGFAFWTNPIEGITVEQPFFRALPTINGDFLSLHHTFLSMIAAMEPNRDRHIGATSGSA